jgi:hypothetical protein
MPATGRCSTRRSKLAWAVESDRPLEVGGGECAHVGREVGRREAGPGARPLLAGERPHLVDERGPGDPTRQGDVEPPPGRCLHEGGPTSVAGVVGHREGLPDGAGGIADQGRHRLGEPGLTRRLLGLVGPLATGAPGLGLEAAAAVPAAGAREEEGHGGQRRPGCLHAAASMARRSLDPMPPRTPTRAWRRALGFGLLAGALTGFALIGLISAPLFLWAKATEPGLGLQRPLVRDGLRLAPFLGLLAFAVTAVLSVRWRLREQDPGASQNDRHG